jgi:hypothetical protein
MAAFPNIGFTSMTMRLRSATAISSSPFTYDQQVYQHQGVCWEAEVTLPPLKRNDAKAVEAFFAALRGQGGTFTMGNPLHTVANETGSYITLGDKGATTVTGTVSSVVEVGDYFEIGGALYILTAENASTLEIMPPLRTAISTSTTLDFTLPKGTWRLTSNEIDWNINRAGLYGFTFACVEAL